MPDSFDAAQSNAGTGGIVWAYDSFADNVGNARGMMFSAICIPDGPGYTRLSAAYPMPVQVAALPLPSGAGTAANQLLILAGLTSIDGHVDGLEAIATSIDGKIIACNTGAVTIAAALPAGANAIGKLAANAGVIIGAVEIAAAQTLGTVTNVTTVGTVNSLTQFNGNNIATNSGNKDNGTLRVVLATDQPALSNAQPVNDRPATSGGLTMHRAISAASTNATNVKASAGQVYDIQVFNTNANPRYLKLYNKASAPSVGSDTPVKTILIPGNAAGAGVVKNWDKGLEFSTGISYALTTGIGDADATAVAANEIVVNIDYK
jgi:hypothetical protein